MVLQYKNWKLCVFAWEILQGFCKIFQKLKNYYDLQYLLILLDHDVISNNSNHTNNNNTRNCWASLQLSVQRNPFWNEYKTLSWRCKGILAESALSPRTRRLQNSGMQRGSGLAQVCSRAVLFMLPGEPKCGSRQQGRVKVWVSCGSPDIWQWQQDQPQQSTMLSPSLIGWLWRWNEWELMTASCELKNVNSVCHHFYRQCQILC